MAHQTGGVIRAPPPASAVLVWLCRRDRDALRLRNPMPVFLDNIIAGFRRIDTNQGRRWSLALCPDEIGSNTMPLDLIWLVAVVTAFAIFAGTLFWADRRTRKLNK